MEPLSLVVVGDLMLGRGVDEALSKHGFRPLWGNVQPLLSGGLGKNQIVVGNLECAITSHEEQYEKETNFKLKPTNVRVLKMASFDYLSLANNHSMDFLKPGLDETRRILRDTGIAYSGVGTKSEAMRPAYLKRADYTFAFFSFADQYEAWAAAEETEGVNYINPNDYNLEDFKKGVQAAYEEKGAQFIVVSIHWGPNWGWYPSVKICDLAHDFAAMGADIIIGHGIPIIYGAGGFVDDFNTNAEFKNDLGFLHCIKIDKGKIQRIQLIPTKTDHVAQDPGETPSHVSKVMRAEGEDYEWMAKKMTSLCRFFGTKIENRGEENGMVIEMDAHEIPIRKKNTPKQFGFK